MLKISFNQNTNSAAETTSEFGARGETLALGFLKRANFRIVCANFKVPVGRNRRNAIVTGEIDIIAYDENYLCFIEVKTRRSDEFASPLAAVDRRKQRQIVRAARMYRRIFHLPNKRIRYDAVSVILNDEAKPKIELFKNYWTEDVFRNDFGLDEF